MRLLTQALSPSSCLYILLSPSAVDEVHHEHLRCLNVACIYLCLCSPFWYWKHKISHGNLQVRFRLSQVLNKWPRHIYTVRVGSNIQKAIPTRFIHVVSSRLFPRPGPFVASGLFSTYVHIYVPQGTYTSYHKLVCNKPVG